MSQRSSVLSVFVGDPARVAGHSRPLNPGAHTVFEVETLPQADSETIATAATAKVFVVDDDDAMRDSLEALFHAAGIDAVTFPSVETFLARWDPQQCGCLILDVKMPGKGGLALQEHLRTGGWWVPIIFITGFGEIPMAVRAMQAGAVDFLEKPVNEDQLLQRVRTALRLSGNGNGALTGMRARIERLTDREREVLDMVLAGRSTREIADLLFRSEKTIEFHRRNIMKKLGVGNVVELVRVVTAATMGAR